MGWKIIEIEQPCSLKAFNGNLLFFTDRKIMIPMNDIDVLLISNNQVNISINAINELINSGVCIITCNNQKLPNSYILGYKVQKQSYVNFEKQLTWDHDFKQKCWNWILHKKIYNQFDLLKLYNIDVSKLITEVEQTEDLISSMLEANVASYFFKSLYGSSFNRKQENIINSILNYGYVILTNMVARSIVKKGLNTNIAFYHGSIYSAFPLAYDVVEVFRIIIDLFTKKIYDNSLLNEATTFNAPIKKCLLDFIANYKILVDGKYEYINNSIDKVIDWIINDDLNNHKLEYDLEVDEINYGLQTNENELEN